LTYLRISAKRIAAYMNAAGVPHRSGRPGAWHRDNVRALGRAYKVNFTALGGNPVLMAASKVHNVPPPTAPFMTWAEFRVNPEAAVKRIVAYACEAS
jgi:hypothetical protein